MPHHERGHATSSGTAKDGDPFFGKSPARFLARQIRHLALSRLSNRGYKEEGVKMPIGQISLPLARLGRAKKLNHDGALPAITIRQRNVWKYLHGVSGEHGTGMCAT